jgi:hypothetical protein
VFFVPIEEKFVFFVRQGKNLCFLAGTGRFILCILFPVFPFFAQKDRERENRKKAGKRETATPLMGNSEIES